MLFVATCVDKPHSLDKRMENRPAHGGALLAADHKTPVGSMIIFQAESGDEVLALLAEDPYSSAGLFESVGVKPWRPGVGQSLA
ncbi:MAG TPA: YciI family protein [Roseiarcus sp.]|nr:YciI family protein [Roseiarcus sp.]